MAATRSREALMVKKIGAVVVLVVALLLGFAATRPDSFHVERRVLVRAGPDKIQPLIADFHRWQDWSPWEKLDPALQRSFGGPPAGAGSTYAWKGNKDVGEGRMEVTAAAADAVRIQLDFIEPFATRNDVLFTLKPQADSTEVIWAMDGPMPFISKLMSIFVSMDALIGKDFEKGLAQLKASAEKG
jgi:hypothetical protein